MRIRDLELLDPDERHCVQFAWNDTYRAYPAGQLLHEVFERQAGRFSDAVILDAGDSGITYADLNARANRLAHWLIDKGAGVGHVVGVKLRRGPELIVAMLAVLKSGAAYLPLDPGYPAERLAFMLRDAGARLMITSSSLASEADGSLGVLLVDDVSQLERRGEANPCRQSGDLAYVMYTSGSTGRPKGVAGLHSNTFNRLQWMWEAYPYGDDEVCCQKTSSSFVDSVAEIWGPLLRNVPLVLIDDGDLSDPRKLLALVHRKRISRIVLVPTLLKVLLADQQAVVQGLGGLKLCVVSGEPLAAPTVDEFRRLLPGVRLLNLYGSTEVAGDVLYWEPGAGQSEPAPVPIGRPIANARAYILDADMNLLPRGARGELYVAGKNLAMGYFNAPAATAERYVPDAFSEQPGQRLFRTGDLARFRPDGQIEYLGRKDHQVKVRGMRVGVGEIEACVCQLEGIRDAVVIPWTKGERTDLALYFTSTGQRRIDPPEVRLYLAQRLPAYMVPPVISELETMPLLPNGKIDRHALPEPSGLLMATGDIAAYRPPSTGVQASLCQIWLDCLGVESAGIDDDFFMVGGNSLDAMRMVAAINSQWPQARIGVRDILELRTIAHLSMLIEARAARDDESGGNGQSADDEGIVWLLDDEAG